VRKTDPVTGFRGFPPSHTMLTSHGPTGTLSPSYPHLSPFFPPQTCSPHQNLTHSFLPSPLCLELKACMPAHTQKRAVTHTVTQMAYRGRGTVTGATGSVLASRTHPTKAQRVSAGQRAALKCFGKPGGSGPGLRAAPRRKLPSPLRKLPRGCGTGAAEDCGASALLPSLLLALAATPALCPGNVHCMSLCPAHCAACHYVQCTACHCAAVPTTAWPVCDCVTVPLCH